MNVAEIREKFPQYSDLSDGQLVRGLHKKFYSDVPYSDFLKKIDFRESVDPTKDMSTTSKVLAGTGKAFVDAGRGVGQVAGLVSQQSIDDAKALDAPLMKTGAGVAGNVLGNAALFAPTAFVPGANTYTGAALIGAGMGAVQPVATGESRAVNAGLGAGAGAAGQAVARGVGRLVRPVQTSLGPQEQALANAAKTEGIPLSIGQQTGSRPLQVTESVMENLPFTSGPQLAGREAQQKAFTAAVLKRAGVESDVADAATLLARKDGLGSTLGNIAKTNKLDFNQGLTNRLADIVDDAATRLPPDAAKKLSGTVDQILAQVDETGSMLGTNYQGWREPLRGLAKEGGATGKYYSDIRKALDSSFRDQLGGEAGEAFRFGSRQYANLKTIIDAMGGAGNLPAKGQVVPAQLSASLSRSIGKENKALGAGDLNELARIGTTFVRDQVPNSGTAQRQFIQNILTGNLAGAVPGAGIGYYQGGAEGAMAGGLLGAGGALLAPRAIQMLMNSPAGRAYLAGGAKKATPEVLRIINSAGALSAPAGVLANRE